LIFGFLNILIDQDLAGPIKLIIHFS